MQVSLFKDSKTTVPVEIIHISDFLEAIRTGRWKNEIEKLRSTDGAQFLKLKSKLPAATLSGTFTARNDSALVKHSGFICLDIDAKDNPRLSTSSIIDQECYSQFRSCSGLGVKLVYKCSPCKNASEHRRVYDAVILRLKKKGVTIKVDHIVKSIVSLQYVSYDPEAYINPKTKLTVKPLAVVKRKAAPCLITPEKLEELNLLVSSIGEKDVTASYEDWVTLAFGLTYSVGEAGRAIFHKISSNYPAYSRAECDSLYDDGLERVQSKQIATPVTLNSVFKIINNGLPKSSIRQLLSVKKAVKGSGESKAEAAKEIDGKIVYSLFEFERVFKKDDDFRLKLSGIFYSALIDFIPAHGFFRFQGKPVKVTDNIIEQTDLVTLLHYIRDHIVAHGDYKLTVDGVLFEFPNEMLKKFWDATFSGTSVRLVVDASLRAITPVIVQDTATESFIPYLNGVVRVDKKGYKLLKYSEVKDKIWKERILPREFKYVTEVGEFEKFFANVSAEGKTLSDKMKEDAFKTNLWYYGYMLHNYKDVAQSRAWVLYDKVMGNEGGTGKSLLAKSLGNIRSMVVINGKHFDDTNRFAFQQVRNWTEVVLLDDLNKQFSLNKMYSTITEQIEVERKGKDTVNVPAKLVFTSNFIIENSGASDVRRQFITQVRPFYKDVAGSTDNVQRVHGERLFHWKELPQWNRFDSFAVRALIHYFDSKATLKPVAIADARILKFKQDHGEDLYYALNQIAVDNNKEVNSRIYFNAQLLLLEIEEHKKCTKTYAGMVVREFFKAVGVEELIVTAVSEGAGTRKAYATTQPLHELKLIAQKGPKAFKTSQKRRK